MPKPDSVHLPHAAIEHMSTTAQTHLPDHLAGNFDHGPHDGAIAGSETISGLTQSILQDEPEGPEEPSLFGDFSSFLGTGPLVGSETISGLTQAILQEEPDGPEEPSLFGDFSSFLGRVGGETISGLTVAHLTFAHLYAHEFESAVADPDGSFSFVHDATVTLTLLSGASASLLLA